MGNKIVDSLFGRKPRAVTTQNVARLGKVAHELPSSKHPKKLKYLGPCLFDFDDRGEVYIKPAKLNKKTQLPSKTDLRRSEQAKQHVITHFKEPASRLTYGRNQKGQFNNVLAWVGISKLGATFTLEQVSETFAPVSMHRQCAAAHKQSQDVIQGVKHMKGSPEKHLVDGPPSIDPPAPAAPSKQCVAANEAGAVFSDVLKHWVPRTDEDKVLFDKKFRQVTQLECLARNLGADETQRFDFDDLRNAVLLKPDREVDESLRQWR